MVLRESSLPLLILRMRCRFRDLRSEFAYFPASYCLA